MDALIVGRNLAARFGHDHPRQSPLSVDAHAGNKVSNFVAPLRNHFQVRELTCPAEERAIYGRDGAARCSAAVRAFANGGGSTMTEGFFHLGSTGLAGQGSIAGPSPSAASERTDHVRVAIGWLPIFVLLVAAAWLLMSDHARRQAAAGAVHLAAVPSREYATVGLVRGTAFNPSETIAPAQGAPADGLSISSQSWRRGGLGSNALVTLTLRNDNDYAVRDIEITCAFTRPDGSRLTDRTRLIRETVNMKSRKTFSRLHVGFVNVNATGAQCSVVAARHV